MELKKNRGGHCAKKLFIAAVKKIMAVTFKQEQVD
jgi:hypothetical protein